MAVENASEWRAELAFDPEDGKPASVATYCPACWTDEFASGQPA